VLNSRDDDRDEICGKEKDDDGDGRVVRVAIIFEGTEKAEIKARREEAAMAQRAIADAIRFV
jgi:hypothetical protein